MWWVALAEPTAEQGQTTSMLQSQIPQIQRKAGRHRLLATENTTRVGRTEQINLKNFSNTSDPWWSSLSFYLINYIIIIFSSMHWGLNVEIHKNNNYNKVGHVFKCEILAKWELVQKSTNDVGKFMIKWCICHFSRYANIYFSLNFAQSFKIQCQNSSKFSFQRHFHYDLHWSASSKGCFWLYY